MKKPIFVTQPYLPPLAEFIPYLEMQLNTQIGNFALDGGDFSGAARAYFNSQAFKSTPPKLIIWEIPERVIEMGRTNDMKIQGFAPN
jgi:alginate O-acetyltransferase complex protein AlgJ